MDSLLLVDDDLELCQMLAEYLQLEGYQVDQAHDGRQALEQVQQNRYRAIILDVMMPQLNGFDTLKQLRLQTGSERTTPVLMMSARGEEVDRILGLEIGADDYLPKPCSPRELLARIRALLRRVDLEHEREQANEVPLQMGTLSLDPQNLSATIDGRELELTQTEFRMLECLMQHASQLVSKETLTRHALNRSLGPYDRSTDMHLSNLRKKLSQAGVEQVQIQTVRGAGYRLFQKRDAR